MSGPKAVHYTVEELREMREKSDLALQRSREEVLLLEFERFDGECAVFARVYGGSFTSPVFRKAGSGQTSEGLRTRLDQAQDTLAAARAELANLTARARLHRLTERLRTLAPAHTQAVDQSQELDHVSAPVQAPSAAAPFAARVESYLAALAPTAVLSDEFVALAASLESARDSSGAGQALRALQDEVGRLNRAESEREAQLALLHDLSIRAGVLGAEGDEVRALLAAAADASAARRDFDPVALESALTAAELASRHARDRTYVSGTVSDILKGLGYETVQGFETVVPSNGQLVRKSGWAHHGLLVTVDDEEIKLAVVRTAEEADAASSQVRDVETEVAMCEDLPELLDDLGAKGIKPDAVRKVLPGKVSVRVLAGATAAPAPSTAKRAQPQQRAR